MVEFEFLLHKKVKILAEVSNAIINKKQVQVVTYPCMINTVKEFEGYKEENFVFVEPDDFSTISDKLPTL